MTFLRKKDYDLIVYSQREGGDQKYCALIADYMGQVEVIQSILVHTTDIYLLVYSSHNFSQNCKFLTSSINILRSQGGGV